MSFTQKRKNRSILPIKENSSDDSSVDPQKNKPTKSFGLDFKSPKLNRLKNFIKNPVPKSQTRYRQFQDNEDNNTESVDSTNLSINTFSDNDPTVNIPTVISDSKLLGITSLDYDLSASSLSNEQPESTKGISQTSLLTTISSVAAETSLLHPAVSSPNINTRRATIAGTMSRTYQPDNNQIQNSPGQIKSRLTPVSSIAEAGVTSKTTGSKSLQPPKYLDSPDIIIHGKPSTNITLLPPLTKSLSSNAIMEYKEPEFVKEDAEQDKHEDNVEMVDQTDESQTNSHPISGNNKSSKWDPNKVDVENTEIMLQNLEDHINNTRQKLKEAHSNKERNVNDLLSGFMKQSDQSLPGESIRKEFEQKNRSNEKSLEKIRKFLQELEFRRSVIYQEGIPKNIDPKEYVKHLSSSRKCQKTKEISNKEKHPLVTNFIKGNSLKSASAENVSQIPSNNPSQFEEWLKAKKTKSEAQKKSATLDSSKSKSSSSNDPSNSQPPIGMTSTPKKITGSGSLNIADTMTPPSAISQGHQHHQHNKVRSANSHSNSVCSGGMSGVAGAAISRITGDQMTHEMELHRKHSISVISNESGGFDNINLNGTGGIGRLDEILERWRRAILEEAEKNSLENLDRFRYDENCKLDAFQSELLLIRDEVEGLRHQIKELHERIDKNTADLNQKITMSGVSLATDLKTIKEKMDYQLEIARRFLLEKIECCNNNINLIEKKTEQLPLYSKYSEKGDARIIADHFFNLVVSLLAFIMLLLSSGFHLLIKAYSLGAAISRYRFVIIPPFLIISFIAILISFENPYLVSMQAGLQKFILSIFPSSWLHNEPKN